MKLIKCSVADSDKRAQFSSFSQHIRIETALAKKSINLLKIVQWNLVTQQSKDKNIVHGLLIRDTTKSSMNNIQVLPNRPSQPSRQSVIEQATKHIFNMKQIEHKTQQTQSQKLSNDCKQGETGNDKRQKIDMTSKQLSNEKTDTKLQLPTSEYKPPKLFVESDNESDDDSGDDDIVSKLESRLQDQDDK